MSGQPGRPHGRDEARDTTDGELVDPRDLVPEDDRAEELAVPHEVLPDDERDVDDTVEQEAERLLPDEQRPVPGGPADDVL